MSQSALVLFSGGQDSSTCLAWALEKYKKIETVGFFYNQVHRIELECRQTILKNIVNICSSWNERLGNDHLIDLSVLASLGETALTSNMEIKILENGLPNTFVPGRNLFFLITAATIAYRRGISNLVGGMCETDFSGYPDCRDLTIRTLETSINLGLDTRLKIETPLMKLSKSEIWKLSEKIGGDNFINLIINDTHTCYKGDRSTKYSWGFGCGSCPACKLRKDGFKKFQESIN
jgi:7-cyano-7-deazaguanine synthase